MQGGVLSLALLLPASAFPVETSQSSEKEGGLQTTVELFSLLFLFVGFFHSYHANGRKNALTFSFAKEKVSKKKAILWFYVPFCLLFFFKTTNKLRSKKN